MGMFITITLVLLTHMIHITIHGIGIFHRDGDSSSVTPTLPGIPTGTPGGGMVAAAIPFSPPDMVIITQVIIVVIHITDTMTGIIIHPGIITSGRGIGDPKIRTAELLGEIPHPQAIAVPV